MQLQGREFQSESMVHGFNGQQRDKDIQKDHHTALYWEYDGRIGRRWNVDPVKKPWQSDYCVLSGNPIWRIDPNGDDDFFHADGTFSHSTKKGSKIYVQTDKGSVLLTQVNLNSATNRQVVADVVGYYASKVGIVYQPKGSEKNAGKGIVGLKAGKDDPDNNPAFASGKDIFINKKGNKINKKLDDYNNLKSVLVHEKNHKTDYENKVSSSLQTHVNVYLNQIKDENFRKGTQDFQEGVVGRFGNYLLNYYAREASGVTQLEKFVTDFNKNNKAGYLMTVDINSQDENDYQVKIYRNNKLVGTTSYKKIENEGSDN